MKRIILALLMSSVAAAAFAQTRTCMGNFCSTTRSPLNPDMAGIDSTDPAAGASAVNITGPLPPTGSLIGVSIASPATPIQYFAVSVVDGDTTEAVAGRLCDQINANAELTAANIVCQLQASIVGVTNYTTNLATVLAITSNVVVQQGSAAWDAGPVLYMNRAPAFGVPPPASSVGQLMFNGPNLATPGRVSTQYVMLQGSVVNNNPVAIMGELGIYTAQATIGGVSVGKRMGVERGVVLCDNNICAPYVGDGTLNVPLYYTDGSGPGLFIGTRKMCIDSLNYVYLAPGSACPPR